MIFPSLVLSLLSQAATSQAAAPPSDSFGTKDLIIVLANMAALVGITLWSRSHSHTDRDYERIQDQLEKFEERQRNIQQAIFRVEMDVSSIKGLTEPLKEAIRLNISALVPRSNPLREETNRTIIRWQLGEPVDPDELLEAADEVIFEAREDPKLTEAERVSFSLTGASMHGDAITQLNQQKLREVLGE